MLNVKKLLVEIVKGIQLKSVNLKSVSSVVVTTARRVCLSARGSELITQASDAGAITRVCVVGSNRSVPNVQLPKFYLFIRKHGTEPMVLAVNACAANRLLWSNEMLLFLKKKQVMCLLRYLY